MAIQISGTTVIDNSRNITNAGSITGSVGTIGTNATGNRTIQSGGSASGGSNGDIFYIY
mgnify:CR=1 FL=1|jgi:hypothetical protein